MLSVTLMERGGESRRLTFDKGEIVVGRVQGNDIILSKGNVSKRHCRIAVKDGRVVAVDLESTNGTYVNGRRINAPQPVRPTDRVYIGDFILQIGQNAEETAPASPATLERGPLTIPTGRHTQPHRVVPLDSAAESDAGSAAAATPTLIPEPAPNARGLEESSGEPESARITLVGRRGALADPAPAPAPPAPAATIIAPGGAPPPAPLLGPERDTPSTPMAPSSRRTTAPLALPEAGRRPTGPLKPERSTGPMASASAGLGALQREMHDRVTDSPDMRPIEVERLGEAALRVRAEQAIAAAVRDMTAQGRIPNSMDRLNLSRNVLREIVGLGALEELLADVEVSDILIDRADRVQVVRAGQRVPREGFSSERAAQAVIDRLLASASARPADGPILDLRLPDGARAIALLPPLSLHGPALWIRKRRRQDITMDQLVLDGALSSPMADVLWASVATRRNVLFSGGVGAGKTTLLAAVAAFVSPQERVICVEEMEEIRPGAPGWLQLECGPLGPDGKTAATSRELLRGALRMCPDRLIVGELRGAEALDLLQALRAGLDGTLATLHANSPRDGLTRLERLVREGDPGLAPLAARELIASSIHLVVHQGRFSDGVRRVTQLSEVRGVNGGEIDLQDIFVHVAGDDGAPAFAATGTVPAFLDDPERRNAFVDEAIFFPRV